MLHTYYVFLEYALHIQGGFPNTLSYHHFCAPNWFCKGLKAFSYAEDMKKSAGGLQSTVSPPVGAGQTALVGDQEAKHQEAQCIWALRISYLGLKLIIFC